MTTDIFHYFDYLAGNPLAAVTAVLTLGVILVNGRAQRHCNLRFHTLH